ncbi:MAG: M48 family metallopeptidase [Burkholderiales bacterium]
MNFFEGQALARRNTRRLVVLYLLAVAAVIVAVDLVLAGIWAFTMDSGPRAPGLAARLAQVPVEVYLWGALLTGATILLVSAVQIARLAGGGDKVAQMVGARQVQSNTGDVLEKRLLNVVEEMAIASGVRMPGVYVMDGEKGINAFAAGYDISNSVVAVTRGTLETLTRDELQAVIGHEFSHILNGDMRLNIRMMGVLAGIVFLGAIGEFLMRSTRRSRGDGAAAVAMGGLALLVIGYVGLFFARLIKAAVSRQREFLADAASVQFTRNPDGIAGALDQIEASARGTLIEDRRAEDMSHMFFGQGVKVWFSGLFGTHPPVAERIRRAHPKFDAQSYRERRAAMAAPEEAKLEGAGAAAAAPGGRRKLDGGEPWGRSADAGAAAVGAVDAGNLAFAHQLLETLPVLLLAGAHETANARALILALMLAPTDEVMDAQLDAARAAGAGALADAARALAPDARALGAAYRLPLIDIALPAAKAASADQQRELLAALKAVIQADRRVSLHEFAVLTLVQSQLAPPRKPGADGTRKLGELRREAFNVLEMVAHAGVRHDAPERGSALRDAMRAGAVEMHLAESLPGQSGKLSLDAAADALVRLKALAPLQKELLVKGLFAAVTHDGTIRVMEAELMRAVCATIDCPLPPRFADIDPKSLAA